MDDRDLIDQPSAAPKRKVVGSTIGAAFAGVIVGVAVWLFGAPDPPPGFEAALGASLTAVAGYLTRERA